MENGNPIQQIKGFAEKKLHALRENPDESGTRAYLAKMRKGVGKVPGADPELWGILFEDLPEELTGRGNTPGRAELALYAALTLYAIHQQSRSLKEENAHQRGIGFGRAAGEILGKARNAPQIGQKASTAGDRRRLPFEHRRYAFSLSSCRNDLFSPKGRKADGY